MTKILLTGVDGQLGFELARSLAPLGELHCATLSGRLPGGQPCLPLDLSKPTAIRQVLDEIKPQVVVNPAAYTAVDKAESEADLAHGINAVAPATLAAWCRQHNALLLHYSTDYVFPGNAGRPWREESVTGPLGVYGASKLAGEEAIRASECRHLILRTAWVYSARFANFLLTMLRVGRERDELRVVSDQIGTPTTARGLASISAVLLARSAQFGADELGTFHCTHAGQTSWHGFAEAIFRQAQQAGMIERAPKVQAIASSDYPTPARRPAYSVLDNRKLTDVHGLALPDWRIGLSQVIDELCTVAR
ncbi:dTDP-4-dehydrorhamnose reductase [Pseudomarimonas arenosa]|uniref:dTDP-4-dehydrorhamnose reductase n=1 Tax=Pseudomarimonas arenosa TaxID=2774145 RepID=A0AAW3ZLZ3_9GAMM|nr:dTDP-4-dehydrorhamnose reductase [Pseudomarimonas arenosa]MBD8525431.1 dTDP-4-dehydrorhamnose reductase [Pseudomarimonas arenosa]